MVPQGACPMCGSRVYRAGVLEVIEVAMRGGGPTPGSGATEGADLGP